MKALGHLPSPHPAGGSHWRTSPASGRQKKYGAALTSCEVWNGHSLNTLEKFSCPLGPL